MCTNVHYSKSPVTKVSKVGVCVWDWTDWTSIGPLAQRVWGINTHKCEAHTCFNHLLLPDYNSKAQFWGFILT